MAADENKATLRRVYEAFSAGEPAALDGLFAAEFVDHSALPGQAPGLAGTKQTIALFRAAFPDLQIAVEDLVAEGDKVLARVTMRGTHRGSSWASRPPASR
jgi:predicted ester cyclase